MKQSKMDESEDMEITDEKLTAVYSLVAEVSDGVRENVRKSGRRQSLSGDKFNGKIKYKTNSFL